MVQGTCRLNVPYEKVHAIVGGGVGEVVRIVLFEICRVNNGIYSTKKSRKKKGKVCVDGLQQKV